LRERLSSVHASGGCGGRGKNGNRDREERGPRRLDAIARFTGCVFPEIAGIVAGASVVSPRLSVIPRGWNSRASGGEALAAPRGAC
jgi:hypothetical protein